MPIIHRLCLESLQESLELTGLDGEEAQEKLDEDDDLELLESVDEELLAQPTELDETPALEYRTDIRQPVEHHVEPPPLKPTQPPNIVADPIVVAKQAQVTVLKPITGVRRSTRVKIHTQQPYTPIMTGKTYVMSQVEQQDVLHPDAHLEFNDATSQPVSALAAIMTQLSLKAVLKKWGEKANNAMQSEMKQLHFRNKFDPSHSSELTKKQKA